MACLIGLSPWCHADNQTPDWSPIQVGGLPYAIELRVGEAPGSGLPTLQSFVCGSHDGLWLLVAGRTNGLHDFTNDGLQNFPPRFQNTDLWVYDPATGQVWSRSLNDANAGISPSVFNALSATAAQAFQSDGTLYLSGGYLFDSITSTFKTYDTLTALDVGEVIDWVQTGVGLLADYVRQTSNPIVQVTGGDMDVVGGRVFLTFGQNFDGPYQPGSNGIYTESLRAFDLIDDGQTLTITNITQTPQVDAYRRRDHNVVPLAGPAGTPALVALSGVFTVTGGAWTVPVEISEIGTLTMADPQLPTTFKQGMNGYASAHVVLYSASKNQNHIAVFGGISLVTYKNGAFVADNNLPFTSQASVIVRDGNGQYSQKYLGNLFPDIPNGPGGIPLLFGASAQFLPESGLPMIDAAIDLDAIKSPTRIGRIFGGIAAQIPNFGNTSASDVVFEVWLNPQVAPPAPAPTPSSPTRESISPVQEEIDFLVFRMAEIRKFTKNPRVRARKLRAILLQIQRLQTGAARQEFLMQSH